MVHEYNDPIATTGAAKVYGSPDEDFLRGLATASAFVAFVDRNDDPAKRDEFVNFVDRQDFLAASSRGDLARAFDNAFRRLKKCSNASLITMAALRPLVGLSLASVIIRTAERVAAADGQIHPARLRALAALRSILIESAEPNGIRLFRQPPVLKRLTA